MKQTCGTHVTWKSIVEKLVGVLVMSFASVLSDPGSDLSSVCNAPVEFLWAETHSVKEVT